MFDSVVTQLSEANGNDNGTTAHEEAEDEAEDDSDALYLPSPTQQQLPVVTGVSRAVQELLQRHGLAGGVAAACGGGSGSGSSTRNGNNVAAVGGVVCSGFHQSVRVREPRVGAESDSDSEEGRVSCSTPSTAAIDVNGNHNTIVTVSADEDAETQELAKLRCQSVRTEVLAEKYRRKNRCADYPGFAFASSVFSSDTMMKFNIIKNELHNIMHNQLKRVSSFSHT